MTDADATPAPTPALSAIVVTPDDFSSVRRLMRHLRAQTARDQLEVVLVVPSRATLQADPGWQSDFAAVQVIEVGPIRTTGHARAVGILHARAPVVVQTEEHCYPAPDWAAALLDAHTDPWAAVGPAFENANPASPGSWASFFIQHGPWIAPVAGGEVPDVSGHNSSYKRAVLLAYGDQLSTVLEAEPVLHQELRARGYRLYLEPRARVAHLNTSRLASCIAENYHYARVFAATRSRDWPAWRRLVYAVGSPLLPLVRLPAVLRSMRRAGHLPRLLSLLPWVIVDLVAGAVGELVAYAGGRQSAAERMSALEFDRERHITRRDRQALGRW